MWYTGTTTCFSGAIWYTTNQSTTRGHSSVEKSQGFSVGVFARSPPAVFLIQPSARAWSSRTRTRAPGQAWVFPRSARRSSSISAAAPPLSEAVGDARTTTASATRCRWRTSPAFGSGTRTHRSTVSLLCFPPLSSSSVFLRHGRARPSSDDG
jgi:hypothetical protein